MENTSDNKVIIVGAGPAGLAIAACLRKEGIPFLVLEQSEHIANSWHQHYDRLHLHTVKAFSHLPFLPLPEDYPLYVSRKQLIEYFEAYAAHFDIKPLLGQQVKAIRRMGDKWQLETSSGQVFTAPRVVMATGVNRIPNIPHFKGQETFTGEIVHSRSYKNATPFQGKKVLVVGMGNTGAEIALDLSEHDIATWLSVRHPVNIVPRDAFGRPTQLTAMKLAKLPHWLGDRLGILLRALTVGNLSKYGIQTPDMPPSKQLRVTGKTPVIDIGALDQIKKGKIQVVPGIERLEPEGVVFRDGRKIAVDAIILATGYKAGIQDFLDQTEGLLDRYEVPKYLAGQDDYTGLFFLGYDNYSLGGILGIIRRDAPVVAEAIAASLNDVQPTGTGQRFE